MEVAGTYLGKPVLVALDTGRRTVSISDRGTGATLVSAAVRAATTCSMDGDHLRWGERTVTVDADQRPQAVRLVSRVQSMVAVEATTTRPTTTPAVGRSPAAVRAHTLAIVVEWLAWAYLVLAILAGIVVAVAGGDGGAWLGLGIAVSGVFQASVAVMASAYIRSRTERA